MQTWGALQVVWSWKPVRCVVASGVPAHQPWSVMSARSWRHAQSPGRPPRRSLCRSSLWMPAWWVVVEGVSCQPQPGMARQPQGDSALAETPPRPEHHRGRSPLWILTVAQEGGERPRPASWPRPLSYAAAEDSSHGHRRLKQQHAWPAGREGPDRGSWGNTQRGGGSPGSSAPEAWTSEHVGHPAPPPRKLHWTRPAPPPPGTAASQPHAEWQRRGAESAAPPARPS